MSGNRFIPPYHPCPPPPSPLPPPLSPDVASQIHGYPTLKLFVKGKAVDKYTGERSLSALQEYVENAAEDLKEAA